MGKTKHRKRRPPDFIGELLSLRMLAVILTAIVAHGGGVMNADVRTATGSAGASVGIAGGIRPGNTRVAAGHDTGIGKAVAGARTATAGVGDVTASAAADGGGGGGAPGTATRGNRDTRTRERLSLRALSGGRVSGVAAAEEGEEEEEKEEEEEEEEDLGRLEIQTRKLPEVTVGTFGRSFDVRERAPSAAAHEQVLTQGTVAIPPAWDSTLCMAHWGMPELQHEPDPNGYVVFVDGREQLGGNKFLVSDGMYMAKTLGRTLVEYPVKDARVAPLDEASLGLGAYWDLSELCMYHRILDLRSFRNMVADGSIPPETFTTISSDAHEVLLRHASDEEGMVDLFKEFQESKVIVMESTWKSGIYREAQQYLRPNPFYMGIIRMLLGAQQDWATGNFLAVQWRTELSDGDLNECYQEVKAIIEDQRLALGYGTHQVLFNTDLYGSTSGTYKASQQARGAAVLELINEDYPQALNNELHKLVTEIDDSGVRAFVSGLAVASSQVMIGSSLNNPETKTVLEAYRCEKPYSGYITLITEWREEILHKSPDSVIRMFPFDPPPTP